MAGCKKTRDDSLPGLHVSLRKLGECLSLSPAPISLVLKAAPGVCSIPPGTGDRVIATTAMFEYIRSFCARSLRRRQFCMVGVQLRQRSGTYATEVIADAKERVIDVRYFWLTASQRGERDWIVGYSRLLTDHDEQEPKDVSVIGFDDDQCAACHRPSLTTTGRSPVPMGSVTSGIHLLRIQGQALIADGIRIRRELATSGSTCSRNRRSPRGKRS
jgi:DNA-binding LacI/PurR family transcriptional regulator